jgi:hypothetical protein
LLLKAAITAKPSTSKTMNSISIAGPSDWPRHPATGKPIGRIASEEVAAVIPCRKDQIPVLIGKGLLRPLGTPADNATRWFSLCAVQVSLWDEAWLSEVTRVLSARDAERNALKLKPSARRSGTRRFGSPVVEHRMPTVALAE